MMSLSNQSDGFFLKTFSNPFDKNFFDKLRRLYALDGESRLYVCLIRSTCMRYTNPKHTLTGLLYRNLRFYTSNGQTAPLSMLVYGRNIFTGKNGTNISIYNGIELPFLAFDEL